LVQLKLLPLIFWHPPSYRFILTSARQYCTQQWKQMLLLLLGILQFPLRLSPQESSHLLTHHHRSKPPWSQPPLHRTVVRSLLWWQPQPLSQQVRQALRSPMGCLVRVQVLYFPTPLYRLQVWGQGALALLCKVTQGTLLLLLTLSLTEEVIYLLRRLHSVARINNPLDNLHTIVYLEQGVKDHLCIICQ
jgi:hypothetical protein